MGCENNGWDDLWQLHFLGLQEEVLSCDCQCHQHRSFGFANGVWDEVRKSLLDSLYFLISALHDVLRCYRWCTHRVSLEIRPKEWIWIFELPHSYIIRSRRYDWLRSRRHDSSQFKQESQSKHILWGLHGVDCSNVLSHFAFKSKSGTWDSFEG